MPKRPRQPVAWHKEKITNSLDITLGLSEEKKVVRTNKAEIVLADTIEYGKALFIDGELQSTIKDEYIYHEMLVCPFMKFLRPSTVKILGGGEGATAREVLKWAEVKKCVQVDWDGELVEIFKNEWTEWQKGAYSDKRLQVVIEDAFKNVKKIDIFDLIIVDLPDPTDCELFSEFLGDIKNQLSTRGGVVMNAGPVLPWNGGFASKFTENMKHIFPEELYDHYCWLSFIPSFAFAGEWCFFGVLPKGTQSNNSIYLQPYKKYTEFFWNMDCKIPLDYPSDLRHFNKSK